MIASKDYAKSIDNALSAARSAYDNAPHATPDVPQSAVNYTERPDDLLVITNIAYDPEADDTRIHVSTPTELRRLLRVFMSMYPSAGLSPAVIEEMRLHEEQHNIATQKALAASRYAQADDPLYGLLFSKQGPDSGSYRPFVVHPNLKLPRLALGVTYMYPNAHGGPTPDDDRAAVSFGYPGGRPQVIARAAIWNADPPEGFGPIPVPLPLSK